MENKDGVWRTIKGRRIFIAKGESLGSAMSKSGKFKRSDIREGKREASNTERINNLSVDKKGQVKSNNHNVKILNKYRKKDEAKDDYYISTLKNNQAEKNRINENAPIDKDAKTRVDRNWNRYSEADRRELRHEELQKKLADYKAKKQSNNKQEYPRASGATKFEDLGLDIKDKKAFSDYLQDKYGTDDFRIINYDNKEGAKKIYQEFRDKQAYDTRQEEGLDKFIQHTDMYGGTREYSNEDLKRMEENGIRPMAHSYTGGGWEGVNAHKNLSTSEQAKAITSEMKKQFPDVKIARKSDLYSGGSSIDFNIMSSDKDLFVSDKEIDKMEDFGNITSNYEWERWAKANVKDYEKTHSYWDSDKRKYAKEVLTNLKKRDIQSVRGNEWFLSDYGKKVVSALNKEANSYTYSDNDGMVDYFNHGTYMHISIGKWDKPYQVNDVKAKVDAYKKRKGK